MIEVLEAELLTSIESYLADTGESESAFGRRVARDTSLMSDLRNGRSVGLKLRRRIEAALVTTERNKVQSYE